MRIDSLSFNMRWVIVLAVLMGLLNSVDALRKASALPAQMYKFLLDMNWCPRGLKVQNYIR